MKPELANYLNAEATKLKAAQNTNPFGLNTNITVALYVKGGVVQSARANAEGVDVKVVDADNLEETLDREEIDVLWNLWEKRCPVAVSIL